MLYAQPRAFLHLSRPAKAQPSLGDITRVYRSCAPIARWTTRLARRGTSSGRPCRGNALGRLAFKMGCLTDSTAQGSIRVPVALLVLLAAPSIRAHGSPGRPGHRSLSRPRCSQTASSRHSQLRDGAGCETPLGACRSLASPARLTSCVPALLPNPPSSLVPLRSLPVAPPMRPFPARAPWSARIHRHRHRPRADSRAHARGRPP